MTSRLVADATIDRGSLESTQIASGVKIDNLVQVAHNVKIGEHTVVAAQTGISGSSTLGEERRSSAGKWESRTIALCRTARSRAPRPGFLPAKPFAADKSCGARPRGPLEKFKQQYAWFARLPELAERLRKLEEQQRAE